ncbi:MULTISPECIES: hypothetical protein [unclassified Bradyrhizobium]|uniref:hypothetical protein n=1 Tax=Bradyrhizobium TaxID=374 RepID=UPI0028E390AC|nr:MULTISPECIES: hypothetical protein [unclassified Bradyrhizobium]
MKSYFLEGLLDEEEARSALLEVLPGQTYPWLLTSDTGDPIAYFNIDKNEDGVICVQADISGRHFSEGDRVLNVLHTLQRRLGGSVLDDS